MDIAAASTSLALQKVQAEAGVSILKKTIDASQTQAQQLIQMLEIANPEGMGQHIDALA